MVESAVNPRTIVQPVIEACTMEKVPVVCINDLKTISSSNFGIPTSCLGIKTDCLPDLNSKVIEIAKTFKLPEPITDIDLDENMDISTAETDLGDSTVNESVLLPTATQCPYLYRNNKKTRVFTPSEGTSSGTVKGFSGQDFIEFSAKSDAKKMDRKSYMKMVLKKISNNPNRVKVK